MRSRRSWSLSSSTISARSMSGCGAMKSLHRWNSCLHSPCSEKKIEEGSSALEGIRIAYACGPYQARGRPVSLIPDLPSPTSPSLPGSFRPELLVKQLQTAQRNDQRANEGVLTCGTDDFTFSVTC